MLTYQNINKYIAVLQISISTTCCGAAVTCCTCCWPVPTFRQDGRQHGLAQPLPARGSGREQRLLVPRDELGVDVAGHELGVAGQLHQEVDVGVEAGDVEVGQRGAQPHQGRRSVRTVAATTVLIGP